MVAAKKIKVRGTEKIRLLIADDEGHSSRRTLEFFSQNGFECRMCHNGNDAKKLLMQWQPKVLLVDLLLPEVNAFEILHFCENEPAMQKQKIAVLVMSGHNSIDNVREAYERGARDYIARPVNYQDLLNRVIFHCREARSITTSGQTDASTDSLKIADLIVTQVLQKLSFEEMLYSLAQMAALKVKGLRCSIVYNVTHDKGIVLASNDKKDIAGLPLDLKKYPEIQLVANTGKMVVIDNLEESRALSRIKQNLKDINFNAMLVCPLYYHHKIFGVISVRMPRENSRIADKDIYFIEYLGKVISLYLNTQRPEIIGKYGPVQIPTFQI